MSSFNPRTHTGCDLAASWCICLREFQSTHPHGVRRYNRSAFFTDSKFQSTHPHGVRQQIVELITAKKEVSIHAPTRGATTDFHVYTNHDKFQSTHPHGVRHYKYLLVRFPIEFQSTHPHGVRRAKLSFCNLRLRFQSTHPHGVRRLIVVVSRTITKSFNPRTHTGCDHLGKTVVLRQDGFNPRTHTGCDMVLYKVMANLILFQSTHPHGVRLNIRGLLYIAISFNPRTHTGCDSLLAQNTGGTSCFNPRTHTGCDTFSAIVPHILKLFQSTHPHGVRPTN